MKEVLMVAEKPNLAQAISSLLSNDSARKGCIDKRLSKGLPLYEWNGPWPATGELVHYKMTSTYGHVCQIDFEPFAQNWNVDPEQLFSCGIVKKERDEQARVGQQLASAGRHADFLVLWLDCDKEGENICFEVMDVVVPVMKSRPEMQRVYRALFSALTETDVRDAFHQLRTPNHNESLSVDARMELDLRIGCAFTRFQTKTLKKKYGRETLNTDTVPYGPCQTPTLAFCVERYKSMQSFVGQPYFRVNVAVVLTDGSVVPLEWKKKRTFDIREAQSIVQRVAQAHDLCVSDVRAEERRKLRPSALNTVQMLRLASSQLRMSPNHTMELAERLYMEGFISYPRTETTQYPNSFDRLSTLSSITGRDELGQYAERLMYDMPSGGRSGQDRGDHPPIVPLKKASPKLMRDDRAFGLYQLICANVLASLSADCTYLEKIVSFDVAGERFQMEGIEVLSEGFTEVLKHLKMRSRNIPRLNTGNHVMVKSAQIKEEVTRPPELLTESDLIDLMEKHGIGTDASIPVHIQSVFKRNFVTLTEERRILPTPMGIAMIDGYNALDDDLSKPQIRSTLEKDLTLIAEGKARKEEIVAHVLQIYKDKFRYLRDHFDIMDKSIASILHLQPTVAPPAPSLMPRNAPARDYESPSRPMVKRRSDPGTSSDGPAPKHFKSTFRDERWQQERGNANTAPLGSIQLPVVTSYTAGMSGEGSSLTQRLLALSGTMKGTPAQQTDPPPHFQAPPVAQRFVPPTPVAPVQPISPVRPVFRSQPPPTFQPSFPQTMLQRPQATENVVTVVPVPEVRVVEVTVSPADSSTPTLPVKVEPGLQELLNTDWSLDVSSISLPTEPEVPVQYTPVVDQNSSWAETAAEVEPVDLPVVAKQQIIEIPSSAPPVVKQEIIEVPYYPPPMVKQEIYEIPNHQWQSYQQQTSPSYASPLRARPVTSLDAQSRGTFRPQLSNGYSSTTSTPPYGRQNAPVPGVPHFPLSGNAGPASSSRNYPKPKAAIPGLENFSIQGKDPVQAIHEMCAKFKLGGPSFDLIDESGPPHQRQFSYQLVVDGTGYGPFRSGNKKECMKGAAKLCLSGLGFSVA